MATDTQRPQRTAEEVAALFNDEQFVKRYSSAEKMTGHFGKILVETVFGHVSDDEKLVVLDSACGPGIVSKHLMDRLGEQAKDNLELTCADYAEAMLKAVDRRIEAEGWKNAKTVHANAVDTKLPSEHYTHITMSFGPFVFSDAKQGLDECSRLLKPGGTLAMNSWQSVGWTSDIRDALATDPMLPPVPSDAELLKSISSDGNWDDRAWIADFLPRNGFVDVKVTPIPHQTSLAGVSELMSLFQGFTMLLVRKDWSDEEKKDFEKRARVAIEKYMSEKYGDGEIKWDWVALMTTAKKPA
ncbi:hypothetical protein PV08_06632 [Exophiala spinifera]|uniref:Methyltransferase domain-containing protein n=1 Tax=Exophiala spinifera TaxID=91928 RepID=A0A0D1ZLY1_9EURO|nr:uncharacterized protein PV08_06632 [Exophiala spinifera]KIW13852.1 hypothetical protein PV08_06632 [Exophiala spinifera]